MAALFGLLARRPGFRRLWLGDVVSYLGDWLTYVSVAVFAVHAGEGLVPLAMVLVAHSVPHALLAPFAGVLADRVDRRWILTAAPVLQAGIAALMALAAAGDALWTLNALLWMRVSVGAFVAPAQSAALPRVVAREELRLANAVAAATWSATFALGVAAGGLLTAAVGPVWAIAADAGTFLVAALLLSGLPAMPPDPSTGRVSTRRQLAAAKKQMFDDPELLRAVFAKAPLALAGGGAWVLMNALADTLSPVGAGALVLGLVQAARGLGTGVGPLIGERVRQTLGERRAFEGSAAVAFLGAGAVALSPDLVTLGVAATVWGLGVGANWVLSTSALQERGADGMLGRLAAIDVFAFTTAQAISALGGAWVGELVGDPRAAAWFGLIPGVLAWLALQAAVRPRPFTLTLSTG